MPKRWKKPWVFFTLPIEGLENSRWKKILCCGVDNLLTMKSQCILQNRLACSPAGVYILLLSETKVNTHECLGSIKSDTHELTDNSGHTRSLSPKTVYSFCINRISLFSLYGKAKKVF